PSSETTSCQPVGVSFLFTSFSAVDCNASPFPDGQSAMIKTMTSPIDARPTKRPTIRKAHGTGRRFGRKRRRGRRGGRSSAGGGDSTFIVGCQSTHLAGAGCSPAELGARDCIPSPSAKRDGVAE